MGSLGPNDSIVGHWRAWFKIASESGRTHDSRRTLPPPAGRVGNVIGWDTAGTRVLDHLYTL
jgi:hypothetical protein